MNNSLSPKLNWYNSKLRVEFKEKVTFTPRNAVNLLINYELDRWLQHLNANFTLKDCFFFWAVKLTNNANQSKYCYSEYGIGFDSRSRFSIPNFDWVKDVVIFGFLE